jgi:hypothetical protein
MADALVAVDERMVRNQREAQGRGLVDERGVQVSPSNVACGCARADSRRPSSRMPDAPPDCSSSRR